MIFSAPERRSETFLYRALLRISAVILLSFAIEASLVPAVRADAAGEGYLPDRTTVSVLAGTKGNSTGTGLDINASTLLLNAGINVMSWHGSGRKGSARYDTGLYLGAGVANLLQFQVGHSSETGLALRMRSDVPLTPTEASWTRFNKGKYWTVTPFVEVPLTSHHGTVFGLGTGWTF